LLGIIAVRRVNRSHTEIEREVDMEVTELEKEALEASFEAGKLSVRMMLISYKAILGDTKVLIDDVIRLMDGTFSTTHDLPIEHASNEHQSDNWDEAVATGELVSCKHCMAVIKESDTTCTNCGEGQ